MRGRGWATQRVAFVGLVCLLAAVFPVGCATGSGGGVLPGIPAPVTRTESVQVVGPDGLAIAGATGTLTIDAVIDTFQAGPSGADGRLAFIVTTAPGLLGWGGHLAIAAPGYRSVRVDQATGLGGDHTFAPVKLERAQQRVRFEGRDALLEDGTPFTWNGETGFALIQLVADGRVDEARAFLQDAQAHGVTVVRALATAQNLFPLMPARGAEAVPATLALAAEYTVYVEVVALADTCPTQSAQVCAVDDAAFDVVAHVTAIAKACQAARNCLLELANEPKHPTQARRVWDPAYLQSLYRLAKAVAPDVPVALGAAHGGDDASMDFVGGDYVTVHGDRMDGDRGWRYVRHTNEMRALSEAVKKFVVNDEPVRDDVDPAHHLALALLCRISGLGDTFHSRDGLGAKPIAGPMADAFAARARGWSLVPAGWRGTYQNTGFADSPVRGANFDTIVRAYSSVRGDEAYTVILGILGTPGITWSDRWPNRTIVADFPSSVQFWHSTR